MLYKVCVFFCIYMYIYRNCIQVSWCDFPARNVESYGAYIEKAETVYLAIPSYHINLNYLSIYFFLMTLPSLVHFTSVSHVTNGVRFAHFLNNYTRLYDVFVYTFLPNRVPEMKLVNFITFDLFYIIKTDLFVFYL